MSKRKIIYIVGVALLQRPEKEMSQECQNNVKVVSKIFDTTLTIQPRLTFCRRLVYPFAAASRNRLPIEIKHPAGFRIKRQ